MSYINWKQVIYIKSEKKLILTEQTFDSIPESLIILYHYRVNILDLSYNRLKSLKGLELFTELTELIIDNNQLGDKIKFPNLKGLKTLSLNNNKITNLNILLLRLSNCVPNIEYLSLLGNQACPVQLSSSGDNTLLDFCLTHDEIEYEHYRYFVINTLTKLNFLDSRKITKCEYRRAHEYSIIMNNEHLFYENGKNKLFKPMGFFQNLIKIAIGGNTNNNNNNNNNGKMYSPLPKTIRTAGAHRGVYCRKKKSTRSATGGGGGGGAAGGGGHGSNSEGNRYICNGDL